MKLSRISILTALFLVALTSCTYADIKDLRIVSRVLDGDTIEIKQKKERVRLACIDAPELSQPLGIMSRNWLHEMLSQDNNVIRLNALRQDRFGRTIGIITSKDTNLNVEMVRIGMAYAFPAFADQCPIWDEIIEAETSAQREGLGVWQGNFVRPWDYRRRQ